MHDVNTAAGSTRAIRRRTPRNPNFAKSRFNVRLLAAGIAPVRSRTLVATFRSPESTALLNAAVPGSMFPAYDFRSTAYISPARSAFLLGYPGQFALTGAASTLQARCRFHADRYQPPGKPSLPSGDFTPLGINAKLPYNR
jgi:hypothetical protein